MTTLEELEQRINAIQTSMKNVEESQKAVLKGLTGFQTAFAGIQQVFGMLATHLGPLAAMDPKKMIDDGEKTNKDVNIIKHYVAKIYTDIYKETPSVEVKKIENATDL